MKIIRWNEARAQEVLEKRMADCMQHRRYFEKQWRQNEVTIYNTRGVVDSSYMLDGAIDAEDISNYLNTNDQGEMGVNYAFKNFRFLHAQASANPPSVVARATSTDPSDKQSSEAADNLVRHAIRAYSMQNKFDDTVEQAMLYGTAFIKTHWNKNDGDIVGVEGDDIVMSGAINITTPSTWDIWFDPQALKWNQVRYIIERKWLTEDEVYSMYDHKIAKRIIKEGGKEAQDNSISRLSFQSKTSKIREQMYPVYCYWEKGMPSNGMSGRHCEFLKSGKLVGELGPSPFRFKQMVDGDEDASYDIAYLPFHPLTDIDVSDQVYGKSFVEYEAMIQDLLNKIDSMQLENIQAHGVVRGIIPEASDIPDDAFSDSAFDLIRIAGVTAPHFMSPPSTMPATDNMRETLRSAIDDLAGVNESMFGQQSREQSGFSMQFATNQGNMIRRRFFNKYVMCVESTYKGYLSLIQRHWDVPQTIQVVGREKSFNTLALSGADIMGGFDLVVEFGANLSLDPQSRREEIMQLMPIFEKAGVDTGAILGMLRLNDVEGVYDFGKMGERRQTEIFQEMMVNQTYIAPQEWEDHQSYLKYSYFYTQTREFRDLDDFTQQLLIKHQGEREALAAQSGAPAAPPAQGGQPTQAAPAPGMGAGMMAQPQPSTTQV